MASAHPTQARSHGRPLWKALLSRERDSGLCLLVHGWYVPATLRDHGSPTPRPRQTKGMRQLVRQRQGLLEASQGLLRVPEQPEGPCGIGSAGHTQILTYAEHQRTALVWRVACDAFLIVLAGSRERAKPATTSPRGHGGQ